jgi:hypothetical protein
MPHTAPNFIGQGFMRTFVGIPIKKSSRLPLQALPTRSWRVEVRVGYFDEWHGHQNQQKQVKSEAAGLEGLKLMADKGADFAVTGGWAPPVGNAAMDERWETVLFLHQWGLPLRAGPEDRTIDGASGKHSGTPKTVTGSHPRLSSAWWSC